MGKNKVLTANRNRNKSTSLAGNFNRAVQKSPLFKSQLPNSSVIASPKPRVDEDGLDLIDLDTLKDNGVGQFGGGSPLALHFGDEGEANPSAPLPPIERFYKDDNGLLSQTPPDYRESINYSSKLAVPEQPQPARSAQLPPVSPPPIPQNNGIPQGNPVQNIQNSYLPYLNDTAAKLQGRIDAKGLPTVLDLQNDYNALDTYRQGNPLTPVSPYAQQEIQARANLEKQRQDANFYSTTQVPQYETGTYAPYPTREEIPLPVRGDQSNTRNANFIAGLTSAIGGGRGDLAAISNRGVELDDRNYADSQRLYGQKQAAADRRYGDALNARADRQEFDRSQADAKFKNSTLKYNQAKAANDANGDLLSAEALTKGYTDAGKIHAQNQAILDNIQKFNDAIDRKKSINENDLKQYEENIKLLGSIHNLANTEQDKEINRQLRELELRNKTVNSQNLSNKGYYEAEEKRATANKRIAETNALNAKAAFENSDDYKRAKLYQMTRTGNGKSPEQQKLEFDTAQLKYNLEKDKYDRETGPQGRELQRLELEKKKADLDIAQARQKNLSIENSTRVSEFDKIKFRSLNAEIARTSAALDNRSSSKNRDDALAKVKGSKKPLTEGGLFGFGAKELKDARGNPISEYSKALADKNKSIDDDIKGLQDKLVKLIKEKEEMYNRLTKAATTPANTPAPPANSPASPPANKGGKKKAVMNLGGGVTAEEL